jgi:hypothetical protein
MNSNNPIEIINEEKNIYPHELAALIKFARQDFLTYAQLIDKNYEAVWFHEEIAKVLEGALEDIRNRKKVRIIITIPPRHGKTYTASTLFPSWALGIDPSLKFILSTYGSELSEKIGSQTRDIMKTKKYNLIFPKTKLKEDTQSKSHFATEEGGAYISVGLGGAITGIGANCVIGDTLIDLPNGQRDTIANLYQSRYNGLVKSFNHETKKIEFRLIKAYRKIAKRKTYKLITSRGLIIEATRNHKIYTVEQGYLPLEEIKIGQHVIIVENKNKLQILWKRILQACLRNKKSIQIRIKGFVLFKRMFVSRSCNKKQKKVHNLWKTSRKENKKVLSKSTMQKIVQKTQGCLLSLLQKTIQTTNSIYKILLYGLQKQFSFKTNEIKKQQQLQTWYVNFNISKRILLYAISYFKKGWKSVCGVLQKYWRDAHSSYRFKSTKQFSSKSYNTLSKLPHNTSSFITDTISMVEPSGDREVEVYDIQVEETKNFFANGILVHNCLIIDDLQKSRAEAESAVAQRTAWEYYRSTLYSRLEGFGAVIVIMQRWNLNDLVARLLDERESLIKAGEDFDDWKVINFPALAEEDEYDEKGDLLRKAGEPLWKAKFPVEVLKNIKNNVGLVAWASQYMQNPILNESQEFKDKYFKYYNEEDLHGKNLRYYTICDPAISQKKEADNTVVLTLAKEVNGPNIYRIREDAGKFTPTQTVDVIFKHQQEYRSDVFIETVAYQQALKFAIEEEQIHRQIYFTVKEVKTQTNKEVKIRGMRPLYERGVIYHKHSDRDFEEELLSFPRGKHDDRIDVQAIGITCLDFTESKATNNQFIPKWLGYGRKKK